MKEVFLLKEGEIALKGLNRKVFEDKLIKNLKMKLRELGSFSYTRSQSTITVMPNDDCDIDEVKRRIKTVYGIVSFSVATVSNKDLDEAVKVIKLYLDDKLKEAKTFKVNSKRADKSYPIKSPELSQKIGEILLNEYKNLKVDLHNPSLIINIEIREDGAYIYSEKIDGAGGIPVGSSGEGMLLISGGIDSPIAGCMMAKRGLKMSAIHFMSPPYTSKRALDKVEKLLKVISRYCNDIPFYIINFTKIQEELKTKCNEEYFTILMRRMMVRISEKVISIINEKEGKDIECLVTGESLAQVASQTLKGIRCTDIVSNIPILRPQIGMDKEEIVKLSRKHETYDISILPYEDCCTVFTPKHPKTQPKIENLLKEEKKLDYNKLIDEAIQKVESKTIKADWII